MPYPGDNESTARQRFEAAEARSHATLLCVECQIQSLTASHDLMMLWAPLLLSISLSACRELRFTARFRVNRAARLVAGSVASETLYHALEACRTSGRLPSERTRQLRQCEVGAPRAAGCRRHASRSPSNCRLGRPFHHALRRPGPVLPDSNGNPPLPVWRQHPCLPGGTTNSWGLSQDSCYCNVRLALQTIGSSELGQAA